MDFRRIVTRQRIMDAIHRIGDLRLSVSRSTLLTITALTLIFFMALSIRLLPIRWGLELSEFDPYVQFSFAEHITTHGYFEWVDAVDSQRWYPLGAEYAKLYPGLPMTAATIFNVLSALGVPISLYHLAVLFPAFFGSLACLAAFFLGRDIGGRSVGLLSAFFLALNPSFISRTSAGFFDDETVGIFAILLFSFLFLRAIDTERKQRNSLIYAVGAGLTLGYITASWGAAQYPITMTALFVFVLVLLRRYSNRLLLSYSITYGLCLLVAINIPLLNTKFLTSGAVLPVLGVFGLLVFMKAMSYGPVSTSRHKVMLALVFLLIVIIGLLVSVYLGIAGSLTGKFIRVLNPLQRGESQIYQSVQEHRLTAWGSLYYDYGVGIFLFVIGVFFTIRDLTNRKLFALILALTSLYFASSMVRLGVLLAPAFCILMAIGIVSLVRPFTTLLKDVSKMMPRRRQMRLPVGREFSGAVLIILFLLLTFTYSFPSPRMYSHAYSPPTILSASLPIKPPAPIVEWTEMLSWMNLNLPQEAVICSWWDYGYWIAVKGNRTSLADNNTINATHIGLIGEVFMSNETRALEILSTEFNGSKGPPTHILVFTTFSDSGIDRGFGDEGKWRWMARIANQTVSPGFYKEWGDREQYNTFGNITDEGGWEWNDVGKNTTIYKLMQTGKTVKVAAIQAPEMRYFKPAHFSPGQLIGNLYALVCLYEVDYEQYELDQNYA